MRTFEVVIFVVVCVFLGMFLGMWSLGDALRTERDQLQAEIVVLQTKYDTLLVLRADMPGFTQAVTGLSEAMRALEGILGEPGAVPVVPHVDL